MTATSPPQPGRAHIVDMAAVCPMCHTLDAAMTESALASGGYWLCARCGQTWNASRLAVRATYENYAEHTPAAALAVVK